MLNSVAGEPKSPGHFRGQNLHATGTDQNQLVGALQRGEVPMDPSVLDGQALAEHSRPDLSERLERQQCLRFQTSDTTKYLETRDIHWNMNSGP